ncbi:acyl-CoA dehydrogenase [Oerskovia turbata]|uniref:Acyl-CoA dehydrogenase n=2 Tax=Oerskovia turbata TaxID=1713 RepID=A0A4Q1KNN4_9CELL|nr:acyl-CoA dehydrogenase [Oerskovia turbata]RXR31653.1 acyl-CoA dehydrogenase [Oerskovia turbata]TGJ98051.1 acyl-CoA dehydrogenase [Actinotalea fermentans ATCC 43279 = JCM 9966 = DSM 3133]
MSGDVVAALAWAAEVGRSTPAPGTGRTLDLWELLASTAAADVGVARVLEPHLDALAILAQVPDEVKLPSIAVDETSTWGVFAAEGPGARLEAQESRDGWRLTGVKPWCSLAATLSHALVTAWTGDGRRLFAVDLRAPGVRPDDGPWVARGFAEIVSAPVRFDGAAAVPVGGPGWYLDRPGFAWGGIGVAACWWGGAVGLARELYAATARREPDQIMLAHLGAIDIALTSARTTLVEASRDVDGTADAEVAPGVLARRARGAVARAVEETVQRCSHALGPGPMTADEAYARRLADLQLYVRQHHAERDDASLGRDLVARGVAPW